ncbi:MAG: hypothetical protein A2624_01110 [Gammaproteobacteria bacterium RIFCSPHIGHO2_01_FULL_42_8]|nr:MAG: hypothetical protein A2624_01110 [Gammaproteobacteria bacterium RIFCSPHIGHO2_01_FULL_42_8]
MSKLLFIGLGRIGLPQALVFAKKGFQVFGYDHDSHLQQTLQNKQLPFYEPHLAEYLHGTLNHTFHPLSTWGAVAEKLPHVDAIFFTLGTSTPDSRLCLEENELNLDTIQETLDKIFQDQRSLKKEIVLIFRTTLPLGSIDRLKKYIETHYHCIEGDDFHLAFVPERLVEGQAIHEEENLPKIVGTYNEKAFSHIKNIFDKLKGKIIRVTDPKTAEFCKLTDNSFRNTLFAFANEIAMHAAENKIDVTEVIDAVNTDYSRNTIQKPGFVSGYCLGKDPYIFEYGFNNQKAAIRNELCSLWYYGRRTNDHLIEYVVHKIIQKLTNVKNPVVTILGLSFKEDVDDFRMSHAIQIIQKLIERGIKRFKVFDPNVGKNKYTTLPDPVAQHVVLQTHYLHEALFEESHAVLIAHRHTEVVMANKRKNLAKLLTKLERPAYLFDAWNVWREASGIASIEYDALGWGGV